MGNLRNNSLQKLPEGFHSDGDNLFLRVKGNSRSWVYRYRLKGKTFELGLGSLRFIDLNTARRKATELSLARMNGALPNELKKISNPIHTLDRVAVADIMEDALAWWATLKGTKASSIQVYRTRLSYPELSSLDLNTCSAEDIAKTILKTKGNTQATVLITALRICQKYGLHKGILANRDILSQAVLEPYMPKDTHKVKHRAYVPWEELPALYAKISKETSVTSKALRFTILQVLRVGETLNLRSEDVDREKLIAVAKNTKVQDRFEFPLTPTSLDLISTRDYPFSVTSANVLAFLRQYAPEATVHGFRSSFSMWCADNRKDPEIREMCLQHVVNNKVASAYQRSDLMEHRRQLLQEWADYVTSASDPQDTHGSAS